MQVISFGSKAGMVKNAAQAGAKAIKKAPEKDKNAALLAQQAIANKAKKPAAGVGKNLDKHV